jgi:hypothetical protein
LAKTRNKHERVTEDWTRKKVLKRANISIAGVPVDVLVASPRLPRQ